MTPAETAVASPAPVYIVLALLLLALVVIADWLDPRWAEGDDSDDGP